MNVWGAVVWKRKWWMLGAHGSVSIKLLLVLSSALVSMVLDLTQLLLARFFFEESENPKAVI